MIRILLLAGGEVSQIPDNFDKYVGVDRGSLFLLENGYPLDIAIGDFDSVSASDLALIKEKATVFYQAPFEKDDTDTELALIKIFKSYPQGQVIIFGALGGRLDHLLANIFLPDNAELFPYLEQIIIKDSWNHISFRGSGSHLLHPEEGMTYISFMPERGKIEILGAKYEIRDSYLFNKKLYTSNEFINRPIKLNVFGGYTVVIQSRDKL